MDTNDWSNCNANVYEIYRKDGLGSVVVGDVIGLYKRHAKHWYSLYGGSAHGATCPGTPTTANGFENDEKWFNCPGEVFKIYARGKSENDEIEEHDDIFLFYVNENKWVTVNVPGNAAALHTCPGTVRPPPATKYDVCWGEVLEIWMQ